MRKSRKLLAIILAATMVVSSSIVALASDPDPSAPVTSGGTDGSGASEGHVDQKLVNVVLPTVASGSTPFAYTMDPERLVQGTNAAKYAEGTTFPPSDSDTGVYFLTAPNTYANTSNTLQAINKSSCAITLTVKVKTTQNSAKDITLATAADALTATENNVTTPKLYLGLKVGSGTTVVTESEQTVAKTIAGAPDNFELAVSSGAYVYQEKSSATDWKALNISMTGAVGEASIASDTTAPTVNVTWSYAEAASDATVDTADQVTYSTAPTTYTVTFHKNTSAEDTTTTTAQVATGTAPASDVATAWTNDGFRLAGWATEATGTPAALSTYTSISEATNLFAIWEEDNSAPSIATTTYEYDSSEDLAITVNLGSGTLAATGISSVGYGNSAAGTFTAYANDNTKYTYSNGTLTILSGKWATATAGTKKYIQVTFNDSSSTKVVLELTLK